MTGDLFSKYLWLIRTFTRAGERGLDLRELSSRWELRFGAPYPRRSFANHREALEEIFGIRIECDRSTNRYMIRGADDLTDSSDGAAWLVNTFTVNSLLNLGKERLGGRVSVENIPSGHRWLTEIMDAMMQGRKLTVGYCKYTSESPEMLSVHPYALKESQKRWYLVAYCEQRGAMRVYGLDRIRTLAIAEEGFDMPEGFDVDELFYSSYGVYLPEGSKAETVILSTTEKEARFLRDLPLHHTQREIAQGEGLRPVRFSLRVIPNRSLVMDLCSYGPRLEVVAPQSLREEVAQALGDAYEIYKNQ